MPTFAQRAAALVALLGTLVVARVSALDVEPKVVSSTSVPEGVALEVAISANRAYIVVQGFGLRIVDISNPSKPEKVGDCTVPGYASDISVSGSYAYVATQRRFLSGTNWEGGGLEIIDISNPASPQRVGSYSSPGASAVAVSSGHAYLVEQSSLRVIDVSNPADPQDAGSILINASAVAVSGNYAYVAQYNTGLYVFDVSDPANPNLVGSHTTNGYFQGVIVSGNYAYVADTTAGLHIVDITQPTAPQLVGKYPSSPQYLVSVGDYVYVLARPRVFGTNEVPGGLHIVRISDPANPRLVGLYDIDGSSLAVSGNYSYVVGEDVLTTVDVADPARPTVVGGYVVQTDARDVALSGPYAYVADGVAGLEVFDIGTPANPARVGGLFLGAPANSVALAGSNALLVAGSALHVIAISDPANPAPIAQYNTGDDARNVTVTGSLAYVVSSSGTNPAGGGLHIIDISTPANPQRVGRYVNSNALDVVVAGNYAYLTAAAFRGTGNLEIIDIRSPANPSRVSSYNMAEYSQGIAVAGDYAYVADGRAGLQVIDISKPAQPRQIGSFGPTSHRFAGIALDWIESAFTGVEVVGNHCYVAELFLRVGHGTRIMGSSVQIIDISAPSNPQRVGSTPIGAYDILRQYQFGSHAQGMVLSGKHLLVAGGRAGLQTVDISQPAVTQVIGHLHPGGYAPQVTLASDHAYIAEQRRWTGSNEVLGGLRIIDVGDPANPTLIGGDDVGDATDVALSGTNACVLAEGSVHIFDITNPANPRRAGAYSSGADLAKVAVTGRHAYVVAKPYSNGGGLHVITFTNPASPQRIGGYDPGGVAYDVALAGNYAYIAQGPRQTSTNTIAGGLQVIDISDPAKLRRAGAYDVEGSAFGVTVSGSFAYLVGEGIGLHILEVTNPANPRRIGADETIDRAEAVAVSGNYAYVMDWEARLHVLDISDPAQPRRIGANTSLTGFYHESPSSLAVSGDKVYAGVAAKGLFILHTYRPIRFQQVTRIGNGISLQLSGPPDVPGRVQRSGDLVNWADWLPVMFGEEPIAVIDSDASSGAYYRIAVP